MGHERFHDSHGQHISTMFDEFRASMRIAVAPNQLPTEKKLGYKSESALHGARQNYDLRGQLYVDFGNLYIPSKNNYPFMPFIRSYAVVN